MFPRLNQVIYPSPDQCSLSSVHVGPVALYKEVGEIPRYDIVCKKMSSNYIRKFRNFNRVKGNRSGNEKREGKNEMKELN